MSAGACLHAFSARWDCHDNIATGPFLVAPKIAAGVQPKAVGKIPANI